MKAEQILDALNELDDRYLEEAILCRPCRRQKKFWILIIAAALAFSGLAAAAVQMGDGFLAWIQQSFASHGETAAVPDAAVLKEELENGQWIYLNGDNVAVILPESPVKLLLSGDGGQTWRSSVVSQSESWQLEDGREIAGAIYQGGYIGFYSDQGGYLALTSEAVMNHQSLRIFLTADGSATWTEAGTPYHFHISVVTGAGFSSPQTGFISSRYYEDAGPDIWRTTDGGATWQFARTEPAT